MTGLAIANVGFVAVAAFGMARSMAMIVTVLAAVIGAEFASVIFRAMMVARLVFATLCVSRMVVAAMRTCVQLIAVTRTAVVPMALRAFLTFRASRTLLAIRPFVTFGACGPLRTFVVSRTL